MGVGEKGLFSTQPSQSENPNDSACLVGGRLGSFLALWQAITNNKFIQDLIATGYRIEFRPPNRFCLTTLPKDETKSSAVTTLLPDMLHQKAISLLPLFQAEGGFFSHIFLRKKPSGKFRLILNLKKVS